MDEKKVREAIEVVRNFPFWNMDDQWLKNDEMEELTEILIEALEKQLPKKPIIKTEKEVPRTHNLGKLLRFHCPNCGKFIVGIYESDTERGGGISNSLKGCSTCLQAIDFSEYYSNVNKDKLNDEIRWDD